MPRTVTFIKNDKGEATTVFHHLEGLGLGLPDSEARRLKSE
jgi:hypothetical protein